MTSGALRKESITSGKSYLFDQLNKVEGLERFGYLRNVQLKQLNSSSFPMLPVDTSNNFHGSCLSKNDSTKSESFVTTTHCSVNENVISV